MFGEDRSPALYRRDIYEHTTNVCLTRLFGLIGSFWFVRCQRAIFTNSVQERDGHNKRKKRTWMQKKIE